MIRRALFVLTLIGLASGLVACDGKEQPFTIRNNLNRLVSLQILAVYPDTYPDSIMSVRIAREGGSNEPRLLFAPDETERVFTAGVDTGRTGYVIVISDESGKELFRSTFPRNELIKQKFRLTITEQGIDYSA